MKGCNYFRQKFTGTEYTNFGYCCEPFLFGYVEILFSLEQNEEAKDE